jgi:drug/metabolite transporter (DMT)-like permease
MWIVLALLAACASAAANLLLKRAVGLGGAVVSTVAFRTIAGVLLFATVTLTASWPTLTPPFWRTLAIVIPNEIGGMVCLSLALRRGEISAVQPIMGLTPLFVMVGGVVLLHEIPSVLAVVGILLVATGLYCVGLSKGASWWEPIRSIARSPASWFAVLSSLFWTVTSLMHKIGIALVGPMAWAASLTLSSALALACALPFVAWRMGSVGLSEQIVPWARIVTLAGACFAVQQFGLHNALQRSQAGYVVAVVSMSILLVTTVGVLVWREQGGAHRIAGALLVSGGVGLIAMFG